MRALVISVVCLVAVVPGCGRPAPMHDEGWVGFDGRSFVGDPYVAGVFTSPARSELEAADFDLVTWPEMDAVAAVAEEVTEGTLGRDPEILDSHYFTVRPEAPLDDRWYAVRLAAGTSAGVHTNGIPLVDGTRVWRFHGTYRPELVELTSSPSELVLRFGGPVMLAGCSVATDAVVVSQADVVCSWRCPTGPAFVTDHVHLPCSLGPGPFRAQLFEGTIVAATGESAVPLDVTIVPGWPRHTIVATLESGRMPPPVPAALRCGAECEP